MNREKIYVICNSHIGLRDPMLALQHIPEFIRIFLKAFIARKLSARNSFKKRRLI